jgi:hypothetical protein
MDLRLTDTNSANDAKGSAFGLEGNDFVFVVVGFVLGLGLFLGLAFVLKVWLPFAALVGAVVLLLPTGWVLLFRHRKPEGYAEDWFDQRASGGGWTISPTDKFDHPRLGRKDRHA